jgi:hypothetical protein
VKSKMFHCIPDYRKRNPSQDAEKWEDLQFSMLLQYEYGMNLWVSAPTKIMGKEYTCAHHEKHPEVPIEFGGRSMTIFCLRASNVTFHFQGYCARCVMGESL